MSGTATSNGFLKVGRFDGPDESSDGLLVDVRPEDPITKDGEEDPERKTALKTLAPPISVGPIAEGRIDGIAVAPVPKRLSPLNPQDIAFTNTGTVPKKAVP